MFKEKQSFREKFLGTYLSFIALVIFVFLVFPEWSMMAIPFLLIVFGAISIAYLAELYTKVKYDGVHIQFFPIHLSERVITWDEIEDFQAEKYNPILEFAGWGIRWRPKKMAYNVSGNKGVRITKKNGKEILIGSDRAEEMETAIREEKRRARY